MIKLALIDNGIPYHMRNNRNQRIVHKSFLASKCDPSEYKDDKSFHGAVCVGIITSICSDIELWDLNVTDSAGTTQITVLLEALEWCIQNKIKLIHMSLGTINYFDIKPLWIQIKRLLDAERLIQLHIQVFLVSGRIVMVFWEMVKFCFKNKKVIILRILL